jgi:predicted translin family RNA/ssDNA-binding protein
MDDKSTSGLGAGPPDRSEPFSDVVEQIHRELQRMDMPCTCKDQLDRTIIAVEAWRKLKLRKDLSDSIEREYAQLVSGLAFLGDLARISQSPLSPQEMDDHAESLKFLADLADRCARQLNELARTSARD